MSDDNTFAVSQLKNALEIYDSGVQCITKHTILGTQQLFELYQQNDIILGSKDVIGLYCRQLGIMLQQSKEADTEEVSLRILALIKDCIDDGITLAESQNEALSAERSADDKYFELKNLIAFQVVDVIMYLNDSISLLNKGKMDEKLDVVKLVSIFEPQTRMIFNTLIDTATEEMSEFNLSCSGDFFIDQFAMIIGWLMGYYSHTLSLDPEQLYEDGKVIMKNTAHDELLDALLFEGSDVQH